ncbi:MAG: pentapeptide repeat-containing protein, partial [Myxococcota bacterium]
AELTYADLSHADLKRADFTGARLFRTRLHRVDDDGATFTDRTLAQGDDPELLRAETFISS